MAFTSMQYIAFFTIACLINFLIPKKIRNYWLLLCSYYFYMCWNAKYAFLMLFSTIITYLSGILINKSKNKNTKKIYVLMSLLINLGILFLFKYYDFFTNNLNIFFKQFLKLSIPNTFNLLLPVGISFYTFQAISYTIDIYRNDVKVEKNFFTYALFVSFFPQLVAGPIEKSKDLLSQFNEKHEFGFENLHKGLFLILIGFYFKLVISDRAAIIVNNIYNNVSNYSNGGGIYYIIATIFFAFQIYFDFYAYSIIAEGSAKVFGYNLNKNFNKPYLATSIKEFWRRWHISLSSWFKEYLYFPLGGSRRGFIRTQINLLIVFIVSGLWHGAGWTFVIWGLLHGLYQVIENIIRKNIRLKENIITKVLGVIVTFILVDFAWIFFRANSIQDALIIIKNLFNFGMVNDVSLFGTSIFELIILCINIGIIFILEVIGLKFDIKKWFYNRNIVFRYIIYYVILFTIIILGIYGPGFDSQEFIYFQF